MISHHYGVPDPDMSWQRFMLLVRNLDTVEARGKVMLMDSVRWGASQTMRHDQVSEADRNRLARIADLNIGVAGRPSLILKQSKSKD